MKKAQIIYIIIGILLLSGICAKAQTVTVRGRLIELSGRDTLSVSAVAVTLVDSLENRTIPVYTGSDGMYVFQEVFPNSYTLEIWSNGLKQEPVNYTIQIGEINPTHYYDIAPIVVKK
ncbi:MAG: carboxypeptidase-like regulatory domain-containing protein [Salinivirgaceae bacterium]|jgi:hypothetical protein